jgi:hypothetical protein
MTCQRHLRLAERFSVKGHSGAGIPPTNQPLLPSGQTGIDDKEHNLLLIGKIDKTPYWTIMSSSNKIRSFK